ncbi:hypothetical protein BaRGS_00018970 [Batillaria attramentaria]|uniref:Uncharacterized protein n=1 Tax=Batillaria attramentaria TaxID=370345 RepID=A0ABD0KR90_9CAEN
MILYQSSRGTSQTTKRSWPYGAGRGLLSVGSNSASKRGRFPVAKGQLPPLHFQTIYPLTQKSTAESRVQVNHFAIRNRHCIACSNAETTPGWGFLPCVTWLWLIRRTGPDLGKQFRKTEAAGGEQTAHSNIRFRLPPEGAVMLHLAKQNGRAARAVHV